MNMQQRPHRPNPAHRLNLANRPNLGKLNSQDIVSQFMVWTDKQSQRVQNFFAEVMLRARQPLETNYAVALQRISEGAYDDALWRLSVFVRYRPTHADAWYHLGSCAMETGDQEQARTAFRQALALNPANDQARFLLTVIDPDALPAEQQPKFAPLDLAASHFDSQAEFYDEEQLSGLGYNGHQALANGVRKYLNPNYKNFQILDLGCGTGLLGPLFREIAGYITGVDISEAMLQQADLRRDNLARKIYDELILNDLRQVLLEGKENSLDLLLAANVFPYVGGLTPVFEGAKRVLKPGGLFAFSLETMNGNDFGLIPGEGRFAHSHAYVMGLAQSSGFDVLESQTFQMFRDADAVQYILRKPAPQAAQPQTPPAPQPVQS